MICGENQCYENRVKDVAAPVAFEEILAGHGSA